MTPTRLLLVEDDGTHAVLMEERLSALGAEIVGAGTREEALAALDRGRFDIVVLDVSLPDGDGFEIQRSLAAGPNSPEIVFVTSDDLVEHAVSAMREGAADYVVKRPRYLDQLAHAVSRVISRLEVTPGPDDSSAAEVLVGESPLIVQVRELVREFGPVDAPILITGETGTGKELAARALHRASSRARHPFIAVNCAAISETLFESEVFGSVRGAYTGAVRDRKGLAGTADGGTLFLDEVSELSPGSQAKLLRLLEDGTYRSVGDSIEKRIDVRVIAATNEDPRSLAQDGEFRLDLYFRLNVLRIHVPPLRERRSDIGPLARLFVRRLSERTGRTPEVSAGAIAQLMVHDWPGNVRELEHVVQRTLIRARSNHIDHFDIAAASDSGAGLRGRRSVEPAALTESLTRHRGRLAAVAEEFGVSLRTIQRRMRELNVRPRDFR